MKDECRVILRRRHICFSFATNERHASQPPDYIRRPAATRDMAAVSLMIISSSLIFQTLFDRRRFAGRRLFRRRDDYADAAASHFTVELPRRSPR